MQPLILCLEEFDPSVKEVAAGALGNIARHTPQLAQVVVDVGGVSLLVLAVQVLQPSFVCIAQAYLHIGFRDSPKFYGRSI